MHQNWILLGSKTRIEVMTFELRFATEERQTENRLSKQKFCTLSNLRICHLCKQRTKFLHHHQIQGFKIHKTAPISQDNEHLKMPNEANQKNIGT